MNAQAVFVVGHSNWGKSNTLKALTQGSFRVHNYTTGNRAFVVRRTSNDDRPPERWMNFINQLAPNRTPHVILTVCPSLEALAALRHLQQHFMLFFWIMRRSYDGNRMITPDEQLQLETLGTVEVFERRAEADERANAFRNFINAHP